MNLENENNEEKVTDLTGSEDTSEKKNETEQVETSEEEIIEEVDNSEIEESEVDSESEENSTDTAKGVQEVENSEPSEEAEGIQETISEDSNSETVQNEIEEAEASTSEYYTPILSKIKEVLGSKDWGLITNEFANAKLKIQEGPAPDSESLSLLSEFDRLKEDFEKRREAHYEELNKKREENLKKKKDLLKEFAEIINEEKWTATKEVSKLKSNWDQITQLPKGEAEVLNERFSSLMKEFDSHKVDRLVKKLEKEEENLTLKLLLLDKMDKLNESSDKKDADFEALDKDFNELLSQWRKVGRVPNDKNQGVWDRFNAAQDTFNDLRFKHDKEYRKSIEKALQKKKNLVAEAEALVDQDNIAKAARKVNKLHKSWKKAGNLPQKDENELWDKFKAATDAFNDKKSDNIDVLREQEEKNYDKKLKLIEQAEAVQDTDDFDKGHSTMQSLMDQWKKIGPVQRKKSNKIWKKFKSAMDVFYERRRDHFKDRRGEEKENLEKKKEILDKLIELGTHEDPVKAVEEAKKLQAEFKDAGYVPIKAKNKIWKQYREACDVIYERYRASGSDLGMERKLAKQGVDADDRKEVIKLRKERSALKKEISKLESESIQYEEAKTFFKPTNKGNKLKEELQEKIDKAEKQKNKKQSRLNEIAKELNDIMSSDEEE